MNYDFKEIASPVIPEDINRGKVDSIKGNTVLMVTKIRNVAAPKVKEESGAAPRMLKISMSDGSMTCHGVEMTECPRISLKTPPGTKIKLKGEKLEVANGFIRLSDKSFEVLGGEVEALVEKWKVSQDLAEFTRSGAVGTSGEGPPKWIPFGQKNKMPKSDPSNKNFKALANGKNEENGDKGEDEEFESKRQEALQEAAKGEQKKFGTGSKTIKETKALRDERARREKSDSIEKSGEWREETHERGGRGGRGGRGRGRGRGGRRGGDRDEEEGGQSSAPSGPVSLFDFLETQIPAKTPTAAQSSKPETKTFDQERPKTDNFNRGEKNPRDNYKDSRGGKKDFDSRGKSSNGHQSGSRNEERRKDAPGDRKDNSDRRKDDSRKKGENKKNDRRGGGDRNSQPKEFAPVFHGKAADKNPEKLDKFERALLAEEAKNKANKTESQKGGKSQQSRENSRTDLNSKHQQQNGYQYHDGRIQGKHQGNDQDFGQWNGGNRGQRQPSNLGREDTLANGMQNMNLGAKDRQRGGFQGRGQNMQPRESFSNGGRADQQQQPPRSAGSDGGQRGRGGGHQGSQRPVWQEGQRCMAKYWEVRFDI